MSLSSFRFMKLALLLAASFSLTARAEPTAPVGSAPLPASTPAALPPKKNDAPPTAPSSTPVSGHSDTVTLPVIDSPPQEPIYEKELNDVAEEEQHHLPDSSEPAETVQPEAHFSRKQIAAIIQILEDHFDRYPEIVPETMEKHLTRQQKALKVTIQGNARKHRDRLLDPKFAAVLGNPESNLKVVVFYDNNCYGCRTVENVLDKLQKTKAPHLTIVLRQWPLNPESAAIAKAFWVSQKKGKFELLYKDLLASNEPATIPKILDLARKNGIALGKAGPEEMKAWALEMEAADIQEAMQTNNQLALDLGIKGTPSVFIVKHREVTYITPQNATELEEAVLAPPRSAKGPKTGKGKKEATQEAQLPAPPVVQKPA